VLLAVALPWSLVYADAGEALSFVEFTYDFDGECVMRDGKMMRVHNSHPSRRIKVYLHRYYAGVQQPGRTVQNLPAGAEPVALGCTRVSGRAQHWKALKARFMD
jgi:hypothetical protein